MNKIITTLSIFTFLIIHQGISQSFEPADVLNDPVTKIELERKARYSESINQKLDVKFAEIEFEQETFNFGTIDQGEKVKNVFVFTNTSDHPLIISNAKGSCGCTVPEWPKEPIMPGESSQFLVVFDSKGKKGSQVKRVKITANTAIPVNYVYLKGQVEIETDIKIDILKNKTVNPDFFNIYPNPTSEMVNISLNDYVGENATIEIFDNSGRLMKTKKIDQIEMDSYSIDLLNFKSGVYTAAIIVRDKMRLAKQFVVR